ncbi:hypothetical protein T492DRAFT_887015 [Pavlovales sp. CCMP2436]|nr:hypothetical protein T492DRAFT_887015 [Pavlovales sp. CCMP2436]
MAGADEAEEGELLPDAAAPANANPPATGTGAASEGVQVFIDYFRAAGGPFACAGVAMLFALKTCTDYASNWWLSQAKSAGSTGAAAGLLAGEHSTAWWLCGYLLIQVRRRRRTKM